MDQTHQMMRQAQGNNSRRLLDQFYFGYSAQVLAVAAAGSASDTVNIQADSSFMLQAMTATVTNTTAAPDAIIELATALVTIQIVDTSSGANIFDGPQILGNVCGTGQLPFLLPISRVFPPNSSLQVTFANNTAVTINVDVSFIGQKLYQKGN